MKMGFYSLCNNNNNNNELNVAEAFLMQPVLANTNKNAKLSTKEMEKKSPSYL